MVFSTDLGVVPERPEECLPAVVCDNDFKTKIALYVTFTLLVQFILLGVVSRKCNWRKIFSQISIADFFFPALFIELNYLPKLYDHQITIYSFALLPSNCCS